jgi:Na+/phosphate symporter
MKEKQIFFNPFRLISPRLDHEASRLEEPPPADMTCLEEGLLIMCGKLVELSQLTWKLLILADADKVKRCEELGEEIHHEEKGLTGDLVCSPATTGDILKTLVLFPGRLERSGDLLESVLNVARIKARDGVPFSDRAQKELEDLFSLLTEVLKDFREVLAKQQRSTLDALVPKCKKLSQLTVDFALAHEDRLIEGLCSPKASSLYLDIMDSVKGVSQHIGDMTESLMKIAAHYDANPSTN